MKPEAAEHLERAGEYLTKARNHLDVLHYNDEAGRAAYLAALHAALYRAVQIQATWRRKNRPPRWSLAQNVRH